MAQHDSSYYSRHGLFPSVSHENKLNFTIYVALLNLGGVTIIDW